MLDEPRGWRLSFDAKPHVIAAVVADPDCDTVLYLGISFDTLIGAVPIVAVLPNVTVSLTSLALSTVKAHAGSNVRPALITKD